MSRIVVLCVVAVSGSVLFAGDMEKSARAKQLARQKELFAAIRLNDNTRVGKALDNGADINGAVDGETPLLLAAKLHTSAWHQLGSPREYGEPGQLQIGYNKVFTTLLSRGADWQSVVDYAQQERTPGLLKPLERYRKPLPPLPQ